MKKWLRGLLAITLILVLVGCNSEGSSGNEGNDNQGEEGELSGEVTLWTGSLSGDPFDSYFEEIEKAFEELHPNVDVIIEDIPFNEMEQKVLTSLTGDDVPDVVNLNPHFMANIASQGGLLELTDLVSEETKNSFVEGAYEAGIIDGELYALPWYLTTKIGRAHV